MEKPMQEKVAFLGAGNIAKAIMGGMLKKGVSPSSLFAADPSQNQIAALPSGVTGFSDNLKAIAQADVVVLAVGDLRRCRYTEWHPASWTGRIGANHPVHAEHSGTGSGWHDWFICNIECH
jgi:hypothetical protein